MWIRVGCNVGMAQELLHRADVVTRLKQTRGKAVAQGVRCGRFGDAGLAHRPFHAPRQYFIVAVAAPDDTGCGSMAGCRDVRQPQLINLQHLPIQKQKCTLPESKPTPSGYREMCQKCLDLWRTHIVWAALVMGQDEPTCPMDLCILGRDAVVQTPNAGMQHVQEFRLGHLDEGVIEVFWSVLPRWI